MRPLTLRKRVRYLAEYLLLRSAAGLVLAGAAVSKKATAALLGRLYFLFWDKRCAYANLDILFRDQRLSLREKKRFLHRVFHNFAHTSIEFLQLKRLLAADCERHAILDLHEEAVRSVRNGRGILLVTAHLGNWEYLAGLPSKLGYPIGVIVNRQFNPYFDRWLNDIRRNGGGLQCFYNEPADMRRLIAHLRGGGATGILADQNFSDRTVVVPFFGTPCAAPVGPAKLHLKYGIPISVAFSVRQSDGRYLLRCEKPVSFPPSGDFQADCRRVTTWIHTRYEEYIRRHPDQWYAVLFPRWTSAEEEP